MWQQKLSCSLLILLSLTACDDSQQDKVIHLPNTHIGFTDNQIIYDGKPFTGTILATDKISDGKFRAEISQGKLDGRVEFLADIEYIYTIEQEKLNGYAYVLAFEMEFVNDTLIGCKPGENELSFFQQVDADSFCYIVRENPEADIPIKGTTVSERAFNIMRRINQIN